MKIVDCCPEEWNREVDKMRAVEKASRRSYLPGAHIPEPFLAADEEEDRKHANDPVPIKRVVKVPMPIVEGPKTCAPRIFVTEKWYYKKKKHQIKEYTEDKTEMQIDMMTLLARRDRIRHKLGLLDPYSKKDSKKIVKYNTKLEDIQAELEGLQRFSGINLNELDHGTRFARFLGSAQRFVHKVKKKISKFVDKHYDTISTVVSVVTPAVGLIVFGKLKHIVRAALN